MNFTMIRNLNAPKQFLASTLLLVLAFAISYFFKNVMDYRAAALLFLLAVSVVSMFCDILPVLYSAFLSALALNFFFINPLFTFKIETSEDILLFLMYFIIALTNATLAIQIRQLENKKREEEEREKTIQLYDTILNSLSHEMRTPISSILGAIDIIKDDRNKLSYNTTLELYNEIETAGYRLNRQVENLLNMSRLEAGTLKPSPDWCDINELIFNIKYELNDTYSTDRVIFEANESLSLVYVDGGFLEMILHNLIHNALKHNPPKTNVVVMANIVEQNLNLSISDNGLGFPKNQMALIFDKFYKLNNTSTGGTGLGLSIVKGFTEALNGKITLENKTIGGALFTIEIPIKTASTEINHEE